MGYLTKVGKPFFEQSLNQVLLYLNWRINKLLLPHNLYSGTNNIPLFSQRPFHFIVLVGTLLLQPKKHYNYTNLVPTSISYFLITQQYASLFLHLIRRAGSCDRCLCSGILVVWSVSCIVRCESPTNTPVTATSPPHTITLPINLPPSTHQSIAVAGPIQVP